MKEIKLTQGKVALVDDEDFEWLSQWKWQYEGDYKGYAVREHNSIKMHREIMKTPPGMETDHKNGDRLNNQRNNLRNCTFTQNRHNHGILRNNKSGFTGVSFNKAQGKWRAYIWYSDKQIHLGFYQTPKEASAAYQYAAKEYFGEFVREILP